MSERTLIYTTQYGRGGDTISSHRTLEGAKKAMDEHWTKKRQEPDKVGAGLKGEELVWDTLSEELTVGKINAWRVYFIFTEPLLP